MREHALVSYPAVMLNQPLQLRSFTLAPILMTLAVALGSASAVAQDGGGPPDLT
jgi:hypothetical protein